MNRYIRLDSEKKVIGERYGASIVEGEILSEIGELGQIMQSDGTFITPPSEPVEVKPTIEEQIKDIKNTVDLLLLKQEGLI